MISVCGAIELRSDHNDWFDRGVYLCKYSFRSSRLSGGYTSIGGMANASCTRVVWQSVGPFDADRFAGDALFSWRAAASGWRPWFEPRAVVEHQYTGTFKTLWQERLARGEDFADARVEFERWRRARTVLYLLACPMLIGLVLARGAGDAVRAGCVGWFLTTLPVQFIGTRRLVTRRGAGPLAMAARPSRLTRSAWQQLPSANGQRSSAATERWAGTRRRSGPLAGAGSR